MRSREYWVYILASKRNGTLYVGMTNNLSRRVWGHKQGLVKGFTKKVWRASLGLFRLFPEPTPSHRRGKATEETESGVEDSVD